MEKATSRICSKCGGRLALRCRTCHKNRGRCRNEYCTGESELICLECGVIYLIGKSESATGSDEPPNQVPDHP